MKFGRMMCMLALAGAALCLTGCDEMADSSIEETTETELVTLSPDEISSIAEAIPTHPAKEEDVTEALSTEDASEPTGAAKAESPFGKAVYRGRSTDWSERFFYFTDNTGGNCQAQEDGSSTAFTFTMDGKDNAVFHFGTDSTLTVDLFWMDDNTVMLYWEDGMSETLTKVSDDIAGFRFYNNEALCSRAMEIYESKNGTRPAAADVTIGADDTVSIRLYDEFEGHSATCEWYYVNRYTGVGTNISGEPVSLGDASSVPAASATEATETQPASETQPSTEATEPTT